MLFRSAEKATVNGQSLEVGKIGISGPGRSLMHANNPLQAVYQGLDATWGWTELTAIGLYKMVVGDISSKNIGGPLTIANISGEAASQGASSVVFLIAILSINLGVLNLLPIPILDGGHLLFFLIEGILRKPLGERQREVAQQVGLVLLVGVMISIGASGIVGQAAGGGEREAVRFGHPSGTLRVGAEARQENGEWVAKKAIMSRSARIIMEGWVRVPEGSF